MPDYICKSFVPESAAHVEATINDLVKEGKLIGIVQYQAQVYVVLEPAKPALKRRKKRGNPETDPSDNGGDDQGVSEPAGGDHAGGEESEGGEGEAAGAARND